MNKINKSWTEKDKMAVWHSTLNQWTRIPNFNIVKAKGIYLYDEDGNRFIDGISSGWVNLHGHSHPLINQRIIEQLGKSDHITFAGFTHQPAIKLAEKLLRILPENQGKIFFSDNGSTAIWVALKITLDYWKNKREDRNTFIVFENAYHGEGFNFITSQNSNKGQGISVVQIPVPNENNLESVLKNLDEINQTHQVAGFIFEPLIQGRAGMQMHKAEYLEQLIYRCQKLGIVTIADEVMTGFGRTGAMFACEHIGVEPDIFCLAKSLTGGYMPLGVTSCSAKILHAFMKKGQALSIDYFHSYTANPIACAAALASLEIFEQDGYIEEIIRIVYKHQAIAQYLQTLPTVENIRQTGTILAFDIKSKEQEYNSEYINYSFLKRGVLLQTIGTSVYIMPPYCISNQELDQVYAAVIDVIKKVK